MERVRSARGQRNKSFEASDVLLNSKVVKSKEKFHTAFTLSVRGSSAKRGVIFVLVELMVRLHLSKSIK